MKATTLLLLLLLPILAACGESSSTTTPTVTDTAALDTAAGADEGLDAATPPEDEGSIGEDEATPPPVDVPVAPDVAEDTGPECPGQHPEHTVCQGGQWICEEGWIAPRGGGACAEATCTGLDHVKDAALDAAISANTACAKDVECVVVPTTTACQGTCGAAVNTGAQAAVAETVAWVDQHVCAAYDYATLCGYSSPKCMAPNPACVQGHCVYAKPSSCAPPQPANSTCQGDHWVCDAGYFQPPGAPDCQKATCEAMEAAVSQAIASAVAAGLSCAKDADCTLVGTGNSCYGTCGEAVNTAAKPEIEKLVATLDEHICVALSYAEKCGFMTPMCIQPSPGCLNGECVYAKPEGPTECLPGQFKAYGGTCLDATCENMASAKNDAIQAAVEKAKVCTSDEDCIIVDTSTQCGGTCGVAVNSGMQNDVLIIVGWVDDNICKPQGYPEKCGYATPDCMMPKPGCDAGACVYSK